MVCSRATRSLVPKPLTRDFVCVSVFAEELDCSRFVDGLYGSIHIQQSTIDTVPEP